MSERMKIVFEDALEEPEVEDDSNNTFMCHRPPNMSVLDAFGDKLADFASKVIAS
jgi:hypothetical protein